MARPRRFTSMAVVEAAKGAFWNKGYQHTAIEDLERATGLNRSSLYAAFGNKKTIFDHALDSYIDGFIGPRLAPMERAGADPSDVEGFFAGLAELFRTGESAQRGCLMINSIAEHEGRGTHLGQRAEIFRDRLRGAFGKALATASEPALVGERAQILTATTFGIWLMARIDPGDAAQTCDTVIAQICSWIQPTTERTDQS
jgi:TetR/AcrR family transcriptional repressor of nem operon